MLGCNVEVFADLVVLAALRRGDKDCSTGIVQNFTPNEAISSAAPAQVLAKLVWSRHSHRTRPRNLSTAQLCACSANSNPTNVMIFGKQPASTALSRENMHKFFRLDAVTISHRRSCSGLAHELCAPSVARITFQYFLLYQLSSLLCAAQRAAELPCAAATRA